MIEADASVFPTNIIEVLVTNAQLLDSDLMVLRRPLRASDPQQCIGIFPALWLPNEQSYEINGQNPGEPTIQSYAISLQVFVKDGDEVRGLSIHSKLSGMVRSMLYRSSAVRLGLAQLSSASNGSTERLMRWGVRRQQFLSNEVQASWLYLSTLEIWCDVTCQSI